MLGRRRKKREALAERIIAVTGTVMAERGIERPVALDVSLAEDGLGLDSLARLELLHAVEEQLGVRVPDVYWGTKPLRDLNHLVRIIRE